MTPPRSDEFLAACRDTDPEAFYPEFRTSPVIPMTLEICCGCEIRAACLRWSLDQREPSGTWGGMTEWERRRVLGTPRRSSSTGARERKARMLAELRAAGAGIEDVMRALGITRDRARDHVRSWQVAA